MLKINIAPIIEFNENFERAELIDENEGQPKGIHRLMDDDAYKKEFYMFFRRMSEKSS